MLKAMVKLAPRVMEMRRDAQNGMVYDIGLSEEIAKAAERYVALKNADEDVENYLQHGEGLADVFSDDSEATREILWAFESNKRSVY